MNSSISITPWSQINFPFELSDRVQQGTKGRHLKEQLPLLVSHFHYWSDGSGSQLKNCYCFQTWLPFMKKILTLAWTGLILRQHMDSIVDGIGGLVKRMVWLAVLRCKAVVAYAETFAKMAGELCDNIQVLYVPAATIYN